MENDIPQLDTSMELLDVVVDMSERLRKYSFHNDHIVRGPLCRLLGLVDLLKREDVNPDVRKLLEMVLHEVEQIENVTIAISRELTVQEKNLEQTINELKYKNNRE
ncbi:MAG TPA: hypothetical protein VD884_15375 [Ohtaekwangia sp.]|nr:hypothetical protein [Ohtaekwangia sp.]